MSNIDQKQIIKLCITEKNVIDKLTGLNINEQYFINKDSDQESKLISKIYSIAVKYYSESNGSLLTTNVFTSKINQSNIKNELKSEILALWMDIQDQVVNLDDLYLLVQKIKESYAQKQLNLSLVNLQNNLNEKTIRDSLSIMQSEITKISDTFSESHAAKKIIDISLRAAEFEKEYRHRIQNIDLYKGIMMGIPDIDERTFGWQPGQLIVFLAPSSGGKSVQLLNCALHANLVSKKKVLYFSFEMDAWQCELRHLSYILEIPYWKIKSQNMKEIELSSMFKAYKDVTNSMPYFEYDVNVEDPTPEYIDSRIRELINTKGAPDLIVVDYIGNMTSREDNNKKPRWQVQGDALEHLFKLAKRYNVPVYTAQQINRDSIRENRKNKSEGKQSAYYQDAASGDQRLMHLAHAVIGIDPDKENSIATYFPIKMRDPGAWFEPFFTRWDPQYSRIYPMSIDDQNMWKELKGMTKEDKKDSTKTEATPMKRVVSVPKEEEDYDGLWGNV